MGLAFQVQNYPFAAGLKKSDRKNEIPQNSRAFSVGFYFYERGFSNGSKRFIPKSRDQLSDYSRETGLRRRASHHDADLLRNFRIVFECQLPVIHQIDDRADQAKAAGE